jgi:hypothetical protein
MPIYQGEEIVDVTAPDGTSYKLPRSLVGGLQFPPQQSGINPVAQMPAQPAPPQSVTDGQIPSETQQPQPAPETPAQQPDLAPVVKDVPDANGVAKQQAAQAKAEAKQKAAAAKQAASPAGQLAAANNAQQAAIGDQQNAVTSEADVEAAGHTMIADAYHQRNADIERMALQREADARADLAEQEKKQTEIVGMRDRIAATKIDHKADHPVLGMISVALAGLGSAMKGETENPALEMLLKSIDRKVAGQMADLEQQKDVLGLTKDELAQLKEKATSKLALNNMLIGAASEKAARQVEEIVARTTSDKVRLEGQKTAALLREHGAEKTMQAVQYQLEYDQKERAEKNQNSRFYSQLGQNERFHADDVQLKREDMYFDMQKALAAERAENGEVAMKQMFEMQKENDEKGIHSVIDGQPLLKQAGIDMMKQADAKVAEAQQLRDLDAKSPDPKVREMANTRAQALEDQAAQLRGEARTRYTLRAHSSEEAAKLGGTVAATQSALTIIDDIKALYDEHGKDYFKTDVGRAAIQSKQKILAVKLKDAWQAGAWDKGLANLMKEVVGDDPTKGVSEGNIFNWLSGGVAGEDPEAFKGRMLAVESDLEGDAANKLRALGNDVKDPHELFARKKFEPDSPEKRKAQSILTDTTPLEKSEDVRNRGAVRQQISSTGRVFTGEANKTNDEVASEVENSGSLKYLGFNPAQEKNFDALLGAYQKSGDPLAAKQLVALATRDKRPAVAIPALHALRDTAPELYSQARAQVPKDGELDQQLLYEEKNRAAVTALTPNDMLETHALAYNDQESLNELARRANAKSEAGGFVDKDAGERLLRVITTRNRNRFMGGLK